MSLTALGQSFLIPAPKITGSNTPDQTGKVHIVTGGYTGCGYELVRLLYKANATVYIMGRNAETAGTAIAQLKEDVPSSAGKVDFIQVDLSDLATIKPAVDTFNEKESQLHVLTNNAGVMMPPKGSKDAQGFDLQIGTNCLGPFLLSKLLQPVLEKTAAASEPGVVRVTWAGSVAIDVTSYKPGGMCIDDDGQPVDMGISMNYGQSKAGNLYLSCESARRFPDNGVVHLCWNPGNLNSNLARHTPNWQQWALKTVITYPTIYGGYTELFAAVAPEVTLEKNGSYIIPWGRFGSYRADIARALKSEGSGGNGKAQKFWAWCEKVTESYC